LSKKEGVFSGDRENEEKLETYEPIESKLTPHVSELTRENKAYVFSANKKKKHEVVYERINPTWIPLKSPGQRLKRVRMIEYRNIAGNPLQDNKEDQRCHCNWHVGGTH
jgi:hypothetical protein